MILNDIFNEIIGTTKETFDILKDWWVDVIAVYMFYYYTAKWQKTNQPYCTVWYISKWINISEARVKKARKFLLEKWLIEDVQKRKWNRFWKSYIKIKYIFTNQYFQNIDTRGGTISGGAGLRPSENCTPNAWSNNNWNAWSNNNKSTTKNFKFQSKREVKDFITEIYNKDNSLFDVNHLKYIWPWIEKLREKGYKVKKMEWDIIWWYKYFKETTVKYCWITNTWPAYWEMDLVLERMFNWLDEKEKKSWNIKNTILTFLTKSKWK